MSHDNVGPVVGEVVPRSIDDVADEVVCRVSGNVEHSRPDACISAAHECHRRDGEASLAVGSGEEADGLAKDHVPVERRARPGTSRLMEPRDEEFQILVGYRLIRGRESVEQVAREPVGAQGPWAQPWRGDNRLKPHNCGMPANMCGLNRR